MLFKDLSERHHVLNDLVAPVLGLVYADVEMPEHGITVQHRAVVHGYAVVIEHAPLAEFRVEISHSELVPRNEVVEALSHLPVDVFGLLAYHRHSLLVHLRRHEAGISPLHVLAESRVALVLLALHKVCGNDIELRLTV